MVSCSRDLEIWENIKESSSTVNLLSSWRTFSIFSTISSVNWRSSAPLIIMHRHTIVFKLVTPLEHTRTILNFFNICSFYPIINLNQSFSLPNEITDDALVWRQVSTFRTGLIEEGRNQTAWQCSKHFEKKSLQPWESQYTYILDMPHIFNATITGTLLKIPCFLSEHIDHYTVRTQLHNITVKERDFNKFLYLNLKNCVICRLAL